jgi:hypothetical protein
VSWRPLIIAAAVAGVIAVAGCSSPTSSGGGAAPAASPTPVYVNNLAPSNLRPGHSVCVGPINVYETPAGTVYTDNVGLYGYLPIKGKCGFTLLSRTKQGTLTYGGLVHTVSIQPLVTDTASTATDNLFLTQNLAKQLAPGQMRYIDTAALESDLGGYHLLDGFPTAASRFYDYYAGLSVINGRIQVCLPASNNINTLESGNNGSPSLSVHLLLDGQDCTLPKPTGQPGNQLSVGSMSLGQHVFGECSNLAIGPKGQYFVLTDQWWSKVGMPGYSSWPLHVEITRTATAFQVVVIDQGSCLQYEPPIVPIVRG